jgi:hypothetical protein
MADFSALFAQMKKERVAAFVYQKGGRTRFRDRLVLGRGGRAQFQRFNYGEAAGLVFQMWGLVEGDAICWQDARVDYGRKAEAPVRLTGSEGGSLLFDGEPAPWQAQAPLKSWPEGGLGRLRLLLGG